MVGGSALVPVFHRDLNLLNSATERLAAYPGIGEGELVARTGAPYPALYVGDQGGAQSREIAILSATSV